MLKTLVTLKFRLTVADLKRSTARLVVWILVAVYVAVAVVAALAGLGAASMAVRGHGALAAALTIDIGSVVVLGWTLLPLVFFGSDQTLDPVRFAPFPLTGRQLAPGLIAAGVVGLPGLATVVLALGSSLPWLRTPGVLVIGLVGGALGFLMTQVGCRVAATALSGSLTTRKGRDLSGLVGLMVVLLLSFAGVGINLATQYFVADASRWARVMALIGPVSTVLAWTPLGAPWALVGDAGLGQWGLLAAHLALTVAYLAVGVWLYGRVLSKALTSPPRASAATLEKGDAVARAAHARWARGRWTAVAAISARCRRYWRRDPRYMASIPAALIMPILFTLLGRTMPVTEMGGGEVAWFTIGMTGFGVGFMALLLGYTLASDVAYDSTAWWLHLACGVRGWQDRLGRVVGEAPMSLGLIVLVGLVVPPIVGHPGGIPVALGAMFAFFGAGSGVAAVAAPLVIGPAPLPGESPLKARTGAGGIAALTQMASLLVSGILGLPVAVWAIFARGASQWVVLLVGVVWGGALLALGVVLGGRVMDARGPAILASLMKNDSRQRA